MPHALGAAYQPHLREMTPCVVAGLSDDMEGVRNMAVKAGQTVVNLFGMKCLDQLLPPLQVGLGNPEWRVRLSSLQLLGDLLMRVATENMKVSLPTNEDEEEDEEEEEFDSSDEESEEDSDDEDSSKPIKQKLINQKGTNGPMTLRDLRRMRTDRTTNSLVTALGEIIGSQILGSLMSTIYMLTVDLIPEVTRQAKHVWKALVDNTPAMLRKVMPNLTPKIIEYISEESVCYLCYSPTSFQQDSSQKTKPINHSKKREKSPEDVLETSSPVWEMDFFHLFFQFLKKVFVKIRASRCVLELLSVLRKWFVVSQELSSLSTWRPSPLVLLVLLRMKT